MKRCLIGIICLLLLLPAFNGFAEEFPFIHDFGDGAESAAASENIVIEIDGVPLALNFDSSPEYSQIEGGWVQASFYTYAEDDLLYELYITFPESAGAGSSITSDDLSAANAESSVVLIVSDAQDERYYFSSQMNGAVYPQNSHYAIRLDTVENRDGGIAYTGALSATLVTLDMVSGAASASLSFENAPFSFTIPAAVQAPGLPRSTPRPNDELNSDMRRV